MSDIDALARPSQYVGARVERTEDARFLTGRGRYVDDVVLPNMLHAAFVRSPFPHATSATSTRRPPRRWRASISSSRGASWRRPSAR